MYEAVTMRAEASARSACVGLRSKQQPRPSLLHTVMVLDGGRYGYHSSLKAE